MPGTPGGGGAAPGQGCPEGACSLSHSFRGALRTLGNEAFREGSSSGGRVGLRKHMGSPRGGSQLRHCQPPRRHLPSRAQRCSHGHPILAALHPSTDAGPGVPAPPLIPRLGACPSGETGVGETLQTKQPPRVGTSGSSSVAGPSMTDFGGTGGSGKRAPRIGSPFLMPRLPHQGAHGPGCVSGGGSRGGSCWRVNYAARAPAHYYAWMSLIYI